MAEQEVIKHTKKVYKIWNSKEHSFIAKAKEFLLEILIIVFAVSLSISFHNWSEHNHEQKQVRSFLIGLKADIEEDIVETQNLIVNYRQYANSYTYLSKLNISDIQLKDSLSTEIGVLFSNSWLRPNTSRYTGFSMSGKLLNIEHEKLLQDILNFYQELIPRIKSSESFYIEYNATLNNYIVDNAVNPEDELSIARVLTTPKGKYLCKALIPKNQLFDRYADFINAGNSIIQQINELYSLGTH